MANGSKLNLQRAAMIRELAAMGAQKRALARAFLCSESLVRMVLKDAIWVHSPCAGCRAPISGQHTAGLCARCKQQVCCHCGQPKFPTRKSPRCVTCDREKWQTHLRSREHVCRQCGEALPETRKDVLCTECRSDEQAFFATYRQKRAKEQGIVCKVEGCENAVPTCKSWTRNMCREHAKAHDRRRRSLSRRLCGICEKLLTENEVGLCRECRAVDRRIARRGTKDAAGPP